MSYKVYIVEDDISISTLLKDYIEKYGFEVIVEENFDDIMITFESFKPHLVLLDVNLMVSTGVDVLGNSRIYL